MGIKIISQNRRARFNYEILERYEAGLVLHGSEVKSLRNGNVNLGDAYGLIKGTEVFLLNANIADYQASHFANHDPLRTRKLLLKRQEIKKLIGKVQEKGLTLVPLKLYFKDGKAKVEMALGKSKKLYDKRQTIKRREENRNLRRVLKNAR